MRTSLFAALACGALIAPATRAEMHADRPDISAAAAEPTPAIAPALDPAAPFLMPDVADALLHSGPRSHAPNDLLRIGQAVPVPTPGTAALALIAAGVLALPRPRHHTSDELTPGRASGQPSARPAAQRSPAEAGLAQPAAIATV